MRCSGGSARLGRAPCADSGYAARGPDARPPPSPRGFPVSARAHSLLEAVTEASSIAGEAALRAWRSRLQIEHKHDGTPVTEADRNAERAVRVWIERHFPRDGILGEELGLVRPDAPRRWIVDPIDGTKTFVRGVPLWGSLVAVVEGERVLAGAACFPAVDEWIAAAPGEGCHHNGARTRVSMLATLGQATAVTTDPRFDSVPEYRARWERLIAEVGVTRTWGDCYGYLMVATGRAEVMVDDALAPWDAAALQPIIEEAGGVFTDWRGRATAFGGDGIATNRALAEAVRVHLVTRD